MGQIFLVALTAHHTATLTSCNDNLWINLEFYEEILSVHLITCYEATDVGCTLL